MINTVKSLRKLTNKELLQDIKKYIKDIREFYKDKTPEIEVMARRLYDEYSLNDFYKLFNKLWKSGLNGEKILAINTLILYYKEFDISTLNFLKPKLKDIKSFEEVNFIGKIIYLIYNKDKSIKNEIKELSRNNIIWIKRISVISCLFIVKKGKIKEDNLVMEILKRNINDNNREIQKAIKFIIKNIGKRKKLIMN